MSELAWQKSSYSGSGQNDCIEVAAATDTRTLRLRESDEPAHTLAPTGGALTGLLRHLKAGDDRPR